MTFEGWLGDAMNNARHYKRKREQLFEMLKHDPCSEVPEVGDRVICAAALCGAGMGHVWERIEGTVIEAASQSYKVRFEGKRYFGGPYEFWLHPAVITDVIRDRQAT